MIDWYFAKLGPVFGLALAFALTLSSSRARSALSSVLDRDQTKRRGFDPTGKTGAGGDQESETTGE